MKWPQRLAGSESGVRGLGCGAGLVAQHPGDRIELRVHPLDAGEVRVDHLRRRHLFARDHRGQLGCALLPQLGHERAAYVQSGYATTATLEIGTIGGLDPSEPTNARLLKVKMPPSDATIR